MQPSHLFTSSSLSLRSLSPIHLFSLSLPSNVVRTRQGIRLASNNTSSRQEVTAEVTQDDIQELPDALKALQQAEPQQTVIVGQQSASAKLFSDAAREEAEEATRLRRPTRAQILEQQHENWTGDESIQDAVLRMLVDKYKPLRSGSIQSAEEKIRRTLPSVGGGFSPPFAENSMPSSSSSSPLAFKPPLHPTTTGSWENEPLLPSDPDHKPWHTTFKAPAHAATSIKFARPPPPMRSSKPSKQSSEDEKAMKKAREERKKAMHAGRLTQAKESTLDYKLGLGVKGHGRVGGRPNPVSMKGWTSLVEDRIEKARNAGLFKVVKGRGQPLVRTSEEHNPFIAREEFLMNRIVQRNGAAPPWVEVQGELDTAITSFREILYQSWVRRAVRLLTTEFRPDQLQKLTKEDIRVVRDPNWLQRESSYHETFISQVNSLVRKYNALAPYSVRRPYYLRTAEVDKMYEVCVEDIVSALAKRETDPGYSGSPSLGGGRSGVGSSPRAEGKPIESYGWGISDLIRGMYESITSRWRGR
ncbi:hypothetical protein BDQ12DRAFT_623193 [Crucibulum laeve]|uniref:DnaJ homologue subfamily C member 28 conserved domain-containing protein n=1 Tax=Crucibulum laeve TaxID=68775 RepID=A0A5C3MHV4_9AGAR|nr:hypothetical protein BDQ12DRAFT_623193 [Crucibulum laeve]